MGKPLSSCPGPSLTTQAPPATAGAGPKGAALPVLFADCQGFIFGFSPQRRPQGRLKDKQGFKSWS